MRFLTGTGGNYWRNVRVIEVSGHWRAQGEYVCEADGGAVYSFDVGFRLTDPAISEKRRAELFVSRILELPQAA